MPVRISRHREYIETGLPAAITESLKQCDNVAVSAGDLTDKEIESLRNHFKYVERSLFGQTYFSNTRPQYGKEKN